MSSQTSSTTDIEVTTIVGPTVYLSTITGDADPPQMTSLIVVTAETPTDVPASPTSTDETASSTDTTSSSSAAPTSTAETADIMGVLSFYSERPDEDGEAVVLGGGDVEGADAGESPYVRSGGAQIWTLTSQGHLTRSDGRRLAATNGYVILDATQGEAYTCTKQGNADQTYSGYPGTKLSCTATVDGLILSQIYVCPDSYLVYDSTLCNAEPGDVATARITELDISPF